MARWQRIGYGTAFGVAFGLPVLGVVGSLWLGWARTALFDLCWAGAVAGAFGVWSRRPS